MTAAVAAERRRGSPAGPFVGFAARRLARLLGGLVLLLVLLFVLLQLTPGDPAAAPLGRDPDPARLAANRAELRLDDPLPVQLWHAIADPLRLDFGHSLVTGQSVNELFRQRLPNTVRLAVGAFVLASVAGIVGGLLSAAASRSARGAGADAAFLVGSGIAYAVPEFVLGTLLALVFAVQLGWFPLGVEGLRSMVLPVIALAVPQAVVLGRLVRAESIRQLDSTHVRAARLKRLGALRLHLWHVLPNVLTGAAAVAGAMFAGLLTGSVLIEGIFAWPGIGQPVVSAVLAKDFPVVRAAVVLGGAVVLVGNALTDLVIGALDPRSTVREL